jgi:hypothetical protein
MEHAAMKSTLRVGASLFAMTLFFCGCGVAKTSCESVERNARELQVMSQANRLSVAFSVLESLRQGQSDVATSTLEAEIKSGLTVLYSLSPELKEKRAVVQESISEAEAYVREHHLNVNKPGVSK